TFSVEQPVMTVVCLSVTELRCPGNDWYEFGEFCYKPFSERKTWHGARQACRAQGAEGGDLVSIHSQEEKEFLSTYSKGTNKWIGLKHNPTGRYCWSDGTPLSHTNWADGEPNNHEGREECVEMVSSPSGTYSWWNDLNCDAHQDWICKINRHSVLTHRWPHTPRAQVFHNLGPRAISKD
uniref:C-type lectin domain-containing protein n=1 Tax=Salarias fasciatus TaxID=181472 RepID=A0A672JAX1_SALFA